MDVSPASAGPDSSAAVGPDTYVVSEMDRDAQPYMKPAGSDQPLIAVSIEDQLIDLAREWTDLSQVDQGENSSDASRALSTALV
jgi:hypothetical protein